MSGLLRKRLLGALGFLAAFALVLVSATTVVFAQTPILSAPEAADRVASGEIILLDIRTPQEWRESGLADGAWPVSMHSADFPKQLSAILERYAPEQIAFICATGGRSGHVSDVLAKNGIAGVADVSEGMFGNDRGAGWLARGLPVVSLSEAQVRFDAARAAWE
ncbi:rhodanese-like domain-containing protein [Roseobacteraceae bacterium S113]